MSLLVILFAVGIGNSVAVDKFDLHFTLDKAEKDIWEHIFIQNNLPLSYHDSVKMIQRFNPPGDKFSLKENQTHIEKSIRPKVLWLLNNRSYTLWILPILKQNISFPFGLTLLITTMTLPFLLDRPK